MTPARRWTSLGALVLVLLALPAAAQQLATVPRLFVADVALANPEDFTSLLERAEELVLSDSGPASGEPTVTFVLHGPVLENLLQANYRDNKEMVDTAAYLSALEVIEIKACRTWMGRNGIEEDQLLPFVETVDYAPAAVSEMVRKEGRIYF